MMVVMKLLIILSFFNDEPQKVIAKDSEVCAFD